MGIRKMYVKNRDVCRVTFSLPAERAASACVVGDFNDWEIGATPMKKAKNGLLTATVNLLCGNEYKFRYVLNESVWENEGSADRYEFCRYAGGENSVVVV